MSTPDASRQSTDAIEEALDEFDCWAPVLLGRHGVAGIAVGVTYEGRRWTRCVGTRSRTGRHSVNTETMFSVQSVSKLFTATAVMTLVESGEIDLDAPVIEYLPEFTVQSAFELHPERRITLRHLLSHTAGLTHEAPVGSNYDLGSGPFEDHCASISQTWLRFPVGHHCEYSNLGVDLAGLIVQRTTGLPFAAAAHELLLRRLGLPRTTFDESLVRAAENRADGHEPGFAAVPLTIPMVPSGALYTCLDDALTFVEAHQNRCAGLMSGPTYLDMLRIPFAPEGQEYGYALGVHHQNRGRGLPVCGHAGNGFGFHADLLWSDHGRFGLALLVNDGHPAVKWRIADRLLDRLATAWRLPRSFPRTPTPGVVPVSDAAAFTGQYVGRDGIATVTAQSGLTVQQSETTEALTATDRVDVFAGESHAFQFLRHEDGDVGYMRRMSDGATYYRNVATDSQQIVAVEGTYELDQWGVTVCTLTVERVDDSPVLQMRWTDGTRQRLWLRHVSAKVLRTSTGETLDFTRTPATYAGLTLRAVHR